MILYKLLLLTNKVISDNLKRLLIKFLLQAVEGFKIFWLVLKLAFKWTSRVWFFLYRYLLRGPILVLYGLLHKIKKLWQYLPEFKKGLANFFSAYFSPLVALIVIGLVIVAANLNAQELRPEYYGQKSILFKILPSSVESYDETAPDQTDLSNEGPIDVNNQTTSYVEGVLSPDQPIDQTNQGGINSLISTTQDQSVLISPEITDPSTINKRRDKIIDYAVQAGDVLSMIAAKFGISTNTVLWENDLTINSTLKIGQILRILPVTGITHKVAKGENLKTIALKFKGDANKILEFNKLEDASDIQLGQTLVIPDGVPAAVVVARTPVYSPRNIVTPKGSARLSSAKLQWPTTSYYISQYYSWRHTGLDIANKIGEPTYAAEDGVVVKAGWNSGGYGNYIIIDHGNGLQTLYGHHSKLYVSVGKHVARGEVIGAIGSTGRSTGPHLHFEVRINGTRVNPLGYIR